MATITLRVEDVVKDALEALARSRGITVTDLLRPQVEEMAGRPSGEARKIHPAHLTTVERRSMSLMHQVLGLLDPAEAGYHAKRAEALDQGYTAEYGDEFLGMEPEMPARDCELVWDILDMFRVLKASKAQLGPGVLAGLEHAVHLEARGFDLNDPLEGRLLGYARYLLATGRWTDLAEYFDRDHEDGNSHRRTLPSYQRMLETYGPLFSARSRGADLMFSADELEAVARAAIHPDLTPVKGDFVMIVYRNTRPGKIDGTNRRYGETGQSEKVQLEADRKWWDVASVHESRLKGVVYVVDGTVRRIRAVDPDGTWNRDNQGYADIPLTLPLTDAETAERFPALGIRIDDPIPHVKGKIREYRPL